MKVTPTAIEKPVRRAVPPSPSTPSSSTSDGALTVDSKPPTDVLIDGERKGRTPVVGLKLPVGRHKVTLVNATYSIKESYRVEIKQGQVEKVVKDFSDRLPEATKPDVNRTINPFAKRGSAAR